MNFKYCPACHTVKPIEEFHRHRQAKDGRNNRCKVCKLAPIYAERRANPERYRAYMRLYLNEHPEKSTSWKSKMQRETA